MPKLPRISSREAIRALEGSTIDYIDIDGA
jgi:hypothetical protein